MSAEPNAMLREAVRSHLLDQVNAAATSTEALEALFEEPTRQFQEPTRQPDRGPRAPRLRLQPERLRTLTALLLVAGAIAGLWAGVTVVFHRHATPHPAASLRHSLISSPSPSRIDPVAAAIDGVAGRGTLTGTVSGTFTITHGGQSTAMLHLRNLKFGASKSRSVMLATDLASIGCNDSGIAIVAGTITDAANQDVALTGPTPDWVFDDVSEMGALAITPAEGSDAFCSPSTYSPARIHWSWPAAIRNLASTDHGKTPHAEGAVTFAHGRPIRYSVAAGDTIGAVSARFGITPDDLFYLNPFRRRGLDTTLYTGEGLNLDSTDRQWFWR